MCIGKLKIYEPGGPKARLSDFKGVSSSATKVISTITLTITKWTLIRKKFSNFTLNDILINWEACMGCGPVNVRKSLIWSSPPHGMVKFNVDSATRVSQGRQK